MVAVAEVSRPLRYLEWGPILLGAVGAAAISFVLYTFGSALGLLAVSPHPYRGLSGTTFFVLTALFAATVQVVSYAAGGYLAGRLRTPWLDGTEDEQNFRDGAYGFGVWAVGLVFTTAVLASGVGGILKTASETGAVVAGAAAGGTASNPNIRLPLDPGDVAADRLLRPGSGQPTGAAAPDRDAIVRTLTVALRDNTLPTDDRAYLAQIVSQQSGLPQNEAEQRVDRAFADAQAAVKKARDLADEARKKAALAAFLTAATMALALAAAATAASLGGDDRDKRTKPYWMGAKRFW